MTFADGVDFGRTSEDYARHRAGFPVEFFARLGEYGIGRPGQRVLDLGSGTGTVARGLQEAGADVVASDLNPAQMRKAGELTRVASRAEELPFPDDTFDVVAAGQCWHWFDRRRTAAEVRRLLKPRGRLVIAHFDWLPLPGSVVAATEALIRAHNPDWIYDGGDGRYPQWIAPVEDAGFGDVKTFEFDLNVPYTHVAWLGRVRASAGIGASLEEAAVADFNAAHEIVLKEGFTDEPLRVPHRVWAMIAEALA